MHPFACNGSICEVLMEFSPDVDLYRFCEVLTEIKQWMGTSCHLCCEIMDVEGLWAARVKLWAPPVWDVEWVNPSNKQILLPWVQWGGCTMQDLPSPGELLQTPTSYHPLSLPIQCTQLLNRIWDALLASSCRVCQKPIWRPHQHTLVWYF